MCVVLHSLLIFWFIFPSPDFAFSVLKCHLICCYSTDICCDSYPCFYSVFLFCVLIYACNKLWLFLLSLNPVSTLMSHKTASLWQPTIWHWNVWWSFLNVLCWIIAGRTVYSVIRWHKVCLICLIRSWRPVCASSASPHGRKLFSTKIIGLAIKPKKNLPNPALTNW